MAEKHAIFLESLTKMAKIKPEYTGALKCVAKCYIINEGIADGVKSLFNKAKTALTTDPAKPQPGAQVTPARTADDERLIKEDSATFDNDYQYFKMYANELIMYLQNYGDAAFIEFLMSPDFKDAEARGRHLDNLLKYSPRHESVEHAMTFMDTMNKLISKLPQYESVINETMKSYVVVESMYGSPVVSVIDPTWQPLTEMVHSESWMEDFRHATNHLKTITMPKIADFIAKHGYHNWEAFTRSNAFKMAKNRAEQVRRG